MQKVLLKLHTYVGLGIGLLLAVIGLTGSLIVFGDELDEWLNPGILRVEPRGEQASTQSVLDAVRAAYPNEKLGRVRLPREAHDAAEVCFDARREPRCVYVDPYSAAVLGERVPARSFKGRVVSLHRRLLSGEVGEIVIGVCGLLLLTLSLSGLALWWPGPRRLRIRRGAGRYRTNYDFHRAVGICALLLLAISGATGAAMVFRPTFEKTLNRFSPKTVPAEKPVSKVVDGAAALPLDDVLNRAREATKGAVVTIVNLPTTPAAPFVVRQRQAGEWHENGRTLVHLDQYSGAVLKVEDPSEAPAGTRAANNLFTVHAGRLGGNLTRALQVLVGFAPVVLFTTGFMMWLGRLKGHRRRAAREGRAEAVEIV